MAEAQNSDPRLAAPHIEWNLSELPPAVAGRVHVTTTRVPAFPAEDPSLLDPRKWPKRMVIGGANCTLLVAEFSSRSFDRVRSLDAVKPGKSYGLSYEGPPRKGWDSTRGPSYYWAPDGVLEERVWKVPDRDRSITYDYGYYRSGKLLRYTYWNRPADQRPTDPPGAYELFDEIFARDGVLAAFGYRKVEATGRGTFAFYILGKEVGNREYEDWRSDFLRRVSK